MSPQVYGGLLFPRFCSGPSYAISRIIIRPLLCMAGLTDIQNNTFEDVVITGICSGFYQGLY